ncbi:hypothetical protein OKA06_13795 [Novosphingobium sp. MW5]|nr:hypothetical protein [Novosphingobium sp. MW5]
MLVGVLLAAPPLVPAEPLWSQAFAPVVLVGLLRLLARIVPGRIAAWFEDRLLLTAALAAAGAAGLLAYAVPAAGIALIAAGIGLSWRRGEITSA